MNPDDEPEYWLSTTIEKDFGVYVTIVSGIEAFRKNYISRKKVSQKDLERWGNRYMSKQSIKRYLQTERAAEERNELKNRHYHIAHDTESGEVLGVAMHSDFSVNEYAPDPDVCNEVFGSMSVLDKKKDRNEDTEYLHFEGVDVDKTIDVSFICVNPKKSNRRPIGNILMLNIMKNIPGDANRILVNLGISDNTNDVNPKMVELLERLNFSNVEEAFVEICGKRFENNREGEMILFEDDTDLELFYVSQELTAPMIEELFLDLLLKAKNTGVRVEDDMLCFENRCEGYPEFIIVPLGTGDTGEVSIDGKETKATTRYAYEAMRKHMNDPTDLSFFDPLMYDHNPYPFRTTIICNANNELEFLLKPGQRRIKL
jgi:hypothetical protein